MIFDFAENIPHYFGISAPLDEGLKTILYSDFPALGAGRHDAAETGVSFAVLEPVLRPFSQTQWERHEKYIDIQFALSNGESIGCLPVQEIGHWKPMNDQKDIAYARDDQAGCMLTMKKGMFAVFFPSDAHRPCIAQQNEHSVRKVVVKVPVLQANDDQSPSTCRFNHHLPEAAVGTEG